AVGGHAGSATTGRNAGGAVRIPISGHPKFTHEYEKSVILLKHLLDTSPNLKGVQVEAHFKGWPAEENTLDDADTIVMISDGGDRNEWREWCQEPNTGTGSSLGNGS